MLELNLFIIIFILLIIIYLINNNNNNNNVNKKLNTKIHIFDIVSIIFLLIFIYYAYNHGTNCGIIISLFIWAFFVCTTPIPEAGLLLTIPLKHFFNIELNISQFYISLFASLLLIFFYFYSYNNATSVKIERAPNYIGRYTELDQPSSAKRKK